MEGDIGEFANAMLALVVGPAFFLRERHLAMRTVRIAAPEHHETDEWGCAPTESRQIRDVSLTTFASQRHILIAD